MGRHNQSNGGVERTASENEIELKINKENGIKKTSNFSKKKERKALGKREKKKEMKTESEIVHLFKRSPVQKEAKGSINMHWPFC